MSEEGTFNIYFCYPTHCFQYYTDVSVVLVTSWVFISITNSRLSNIFDGQSIQVVALVLFVALVPFVALVLSLALVPAPEHKMLDCLLSLNPIK